MTDRQMRFKTTVAAAGFIAASVLVILWLLELPIFDARTLAWFLFWALVLTGVAIFALIAGAVWHDEPSR